VVEDHFARLLVDLGLEAELVEVMVWRILRLLRLPVQIEVFIARVDVVLVVILPLCIALLVVLVSEP
jgi:hypothetical protein